MKKYVKLVSYLLVIIGAINWGFVGWFNIDLVAKLLGDMTIWSRAIYAIVGVAALVAFDVRDGHESPAGYAFRVFDKRHVLALRREIERAVFIVAAVLELLWRNNRTSGRSVSFHEQLCLVHDFRNTLVLREPIDIRFAKASGGG